MKVCAYGLVPALAIMYPSISRINNINRPVSIFLRNIDSNSIGNFHIAHICNKCKKQPVEVEKQVKSEEKENSFIGCQSIKFKSHTANERNILPYELFTTMKEKQKLKREGDKIMDFNSKTQDLGSVKLNTKYRDLEKLFEWLTFYSRIIYNSFYEANR